MATGKMNIRYVGGPFHGYEDCVRTWSFPMNKHVPLRFYEGDTILDSPSMTENGFSSDWTGLDIAHYRFKTNPDYVIGGPNKKGVCLRVKSDDGFFELHFVEEYFVSRCPCFNASNGKPCNKTVARGHDTCPAHFSLQEKRERKIKADREYRQRLNSSGIS